MYQILWVRERKTKISKMPYCLTSLCRAYQEYLFQALFFTDFKVWLYRVESCKYLYLAVNLYWFFWLHWSEIFIPKMLSSVAINSSYYSCFNLQVISYKKQKIRDGLLSRRNQILVVLLFLSNWNNSPNNALILDFTFLYIEKCIC